MLRFCEKWWMTAGRGLVAVAFGCAVLFWPSLDHGTLAVVFGLFALVDGLMLGGLAIVSRRVLDQWWLVLVESCVSLAVASVALLGPATDGIGLLALVATWAVVTGVVEIEAGVRLRRLATGEASLLFAGGVSLLVGIALVAFPETEAARLTWAIGWFGVAYGGALVLVAARLRRLAVAARGAARR